MTGDGQPSLLSFYSFDTSAFINGRRDVFQLPTFEPLWDAIATLIGNGTIRSVDEVKRELARKDDETLQWAKKRAGLFVPLDHDIQSATREVLRKCPRLVAQHGVNRNSADPFVVGLALARDGTVVTEEQHTKSMNRPRIPDACKAVGVECLRLPDFVNRQGWQPVFRI